LLESAGIPLVDTLASEVVPLTGSRTYISANPEVLPDARFVEFDEKTTYLPSALTELFDTELELLPWVPELLSLISCTGMAGGAVTAITEVVGSTCVTPA
jgi:hypothetical protein